MSARSMRPPEAPHDVRLVVRHRRRQHAVEAPAVGDDPAEEALADAPVGAAVGLGRDVQVEVVDGVPAVARHGVARRAQVLACRHHAADDAARVVAVGDEEASDGHLDVLGRSPATATATATAAGLRLRLRLRLGRDGDRLARRRGRCVPEAHVAARRPRRAAPSAVSICGGRSAISSLWARTSRAVSSARST